MALRWAAGRKLAASSQFSRVKSYPPTQPGCGCCVRCSWWTRARPLRGSRVSGHSIDRRASPGWVPPRPSNLSEGVTDSTWPGDDTRPGDLRSSAGVGAPAKEMSLAADAFDPKDGKTARDPTWAPRPREDRLALLDEASGDVLVRALRLFVYRDVTDRAHDGRAGLAPCHRGIRTTST